MQHVVPNNVARCCVEMLRAFGQGFTAPAHSRGANMNAPIRDGFDCSSRKPMRRHFVFQGFPELFSPSVKKRALGLRLIVNHIFI